MGRGHPPPHCENTQVLREAITEDDDDGYLTAFWLSPEVSTRDPIISPRALAQGLIMVEG